MNPVASPARTLQQVCARRLQWVRHLRLLMWLVGLGAAYRTSFAQEPADARFSTVVTASRTAQRQSEAATPIDVITRVDIERSGARDLAEVLALHPAVQLERSFAGAGVYVQGLEPQHVLILIDGQRMIGRTNGVIDLSRIPVERIEQVEVSRGASSVLYGSDALGGVINIISDQAGAPHGGKVAIGGAAESNPALASETLNVALKYEGSQASRTYSVQLLAKWLVMIAHTAGVRRMRPHGMARAPGAASSATPRPLPTELNQATAQSSPTAPKA